MPLPKSNWIWFNGKFVPWNEANVHVTAHVLHYGSSVFEGLRAYATPKGPAVLGLPQHLRRLFDSCKIVRLAIPYTFEQLHDAILETVRRNEHQSCYIRPLVFRGAGNFSLDGRECPSEVVIITFEWGRYLGSDAIEQGVDVNISSWRRIAPDTMPMMAKAGGNYLNAQFVAMEAKEYGFVEGIALDVQGYVGEGSGENIFVVSRGKIYTPPVGASILMGITREFVLTLAKEFGYEVKEQLIPRELLYIADEVFFTGTAAEITPIRSIDHIEIGNGKRGPITQRLQEAFFGIVNGEIPDKYGWLTFVS